jgi:hypothetical protein
MAADLTIAVGEIAHPFLGLRGVGDEQIHKKTHNIPPN